MVGLVRGFRLGEKWLGVPFVVAVAWGTTVVTTLLRADEWGRFRRLQARLPDRLRPHGGAVFSYGRMLFSWHAGVYLSFLYDRLGEPRWASRIVIRGGDPATTREPNQPVILTFLHVGANLGVLHLVRSKGLPVMSFAAASLPFMNPALRYILEKGDARHGLEKSPIALVRRGKHKIMGLAQALKAGGVVSLPLDGYHGAPTLRVPVAGGEMALNDGAIRLAISRKALLIPATAIETGLLRYQITYGRPAPLHLLEAGDIQGAAQHIVDEIIPIVEGRPGGLTWTAMEAFCGGKKSDRRPWP